MDSHELEPLSSGDKEPRTVRQRNEDEGPWKAFKSFFKLSNIKLGFLVTFKRREEKRRAIILLTVTIFLLVNFAMLGQYTVLYLYFRKEMSWTHVEYTRYTTVGGLAGTLSQGLLVPFLSTKLKWQAGSYRWMMTA